MIRGLVTLAVFLVSTTVLGLLATIGELVLPHRHVTLRLGRLWSRLHLVSGGVRATYEGLEHAAERLPCVYISNHQSLFDVWALLPVLPLSTRFVAKRSLFRIPFLGWAMGAGGFIPIDRRSRSRAIQSLALAADRIRSGISVLLFAEGTRSRDGRLAPFKRGAFHLALNAGVPVVPIAVSGSFDILRPRSIVVRPGEIKVRIAPPIDVTPFLPDDFDGLLERVRGSIAARIEPEGSVVAAPR